jgi:hypothetical protein
VVPLKALRRDRGRRMDRGTCERSTLAVRLPAVHAIAQKHCLLLPFVAAHRAMPDFIRNTTAADVQPRRDVLRVRRHAALLRPLNDGQVISSWSALQRCSRMRSILCESAVPDRAQPRRCRTLIGRVHRPLQRAITCQLGVRRRPSGHLDSYRMMPLRVSDAMQCAAGLCSALATQIDAGAPPMSGSPSPQRFRRRPGQRSAQSRVVVPGPARSHRRSSSRRRNPKRHRFAAAR